MRVVAHAFAGISLTLIAWSVQAADDRSGREGLVPDSGLGSSSPPWQLIGRADLVNPAYTWIDSHDLGRDENVIGYRWRKFNFEQLSSDARPEQRDPQFRTRISRLSYKPAGNLVLQLARGKLSGLDYLMADESLRRTAVSATYVLDMPGARVESMFAWGRSNMKMRQSTSGFLLESVARFPGSHSVFGRLEQVGSDEPGVDDAARTVSRLNRFSVGYVRELDGGIGGRLQIGGFISHYQIPDAASQRQGDTTVGMMVVRLRLK